jgi:hypothetical protein
MIVELTFATQTLMAKVNEEELRRKYQEQEAIVKYRKQIEKPLTMLTTTNATGDTGVLGAWADKIDPGLSRIFTDLGSFLQDDIYSDDYIKPSQYAVGIAWQLLDKAAKQLSDGFPEGTIYPDGDGGLRVEWIRPDKEVRLKISNSKSGRSYIYYELWGKYAADYSVTATSLASWLKQLNGNDPIGT